MRVVVYVTALFLFSTGCRTAPASVPGRVDPAFAPADPFSVVAEADRLAARDLWPGFEPHTVPVAIYDGDRTLLFRHSAPPGGFVPLADRDNIWVYPGRHPRVAANSSTELGGLQTATLLPSLNGGSLTSRAGTLLHEIFHVFQREQQPTWTANEVELFVYPVDDAELLALRRLETEALHRALRFADRERAACWTRLALDLRRKRFAQLPGGSSAYERGTEMNEGLAAYVERRATGEPPDSTILPVEGFAPDAVRQRGYRSGLALARLLDRFLPQWRTTLANDDSGSLDVLLATAVDVGDATACGFASAELARIEATAVTDVTNLHTRRFEQRRTFLEQPGWQLVFAASAAPLFPQRFDPLNVHVVAAGEVLHTRSVRLENDAGTIETFDRVSLTEAAGAHPLFNGVRTVTVTGLTDEPTIEDIDGLVTVNADGVRAELRGATVERFGRAVTIRLRPMPN